MNQIDSLFYLFVQVTGSGSVFVSARSWLWDSQICTSAWQYGHPGSGLGLRHIWQVCLNDMILLSQTVLIARDVLHTALVFRCLFWLNSDFSVFVSSHSAPYLSVAKLQVETLTTVLYDRQKLCQSIGLATAQLPLLACLLGNDVVSEVEMQHIRDEAMAIYRCLEFYFKVRS